MSVLEFSGFGLGLRKPYFDEFLETSVAVDFVEVISENFMVDGGRPREILRKVRERHPVALHGVSMSIGSAHGLDPSYLKQLRTLADEIQPLFVSDHLSWSRTPGFNSHDLLPLPYTDEALKVVCANIQQAQDAMGREMLIENPSSYLTFAQSELTEWEFLRTVSERTGCGLLLDVNNIYVSSVNHQFDPLEYIRAIPMDKVRQIHLAGHSQGDTLLIDTHDQAVPAPVWSLFAQVMQRAGPVAVMIERDDQFPPLAELLAELDLARSFARQSDHLPNL